MKTLSSNCFLSLLCSLLSVIYIIPHQPFLSIIPNVAFPIFRIIYNLRGNTHIALLLLVCVNIEATTFADNCLLQVFSHYQMELRVLLVGIKKHALPMRLVLVVDGACREILHSLQFLIFQHELLKQFHQIQPVIAFPCWILLQSIVKIEAIVHIRLLSVCSYLSKK